MMYRFIGIDPGSKGAVASIDDSGHIVIMDLSKDYHTYWRIISDWVDLTESYDDTIVYVEDVCGRPGQSCQANTTFMKLAGMAELAGYCIGEMNLVKPQIWKKHFDLIFDKTVSKTDKKHSSVELARKLYPDVADQLLLSKDGRAEALLIARYAQDVFYS